MNKNLKNTSSQFFECDVCDFNCGKKQDYMRHLNTKKHTRLSLCDTDKYIYHKCELCCFSSRNKTDYIRHINSTKHKITRKNAKKTTNDNKMVTNDNKMVTNDNKMIINDNKMVISQKKLPVQPDLVCKCGKIYKFSSGLSRHKQTCDVFLEQRETTHQHFISDETQSNYNDIIIKFMDFQAQTMQGNQEYQAQTTQDNREFQKQTLKHNQEFQTMMLDMFKECMQKSSELAPSIGNNNNNIGNNNNNNSNNTNNINYYLNVTCKDAETNLDFLEQWKERCIELFHDKKELMAERKISFPNMCTDIYFDLIKSKPQTQRFIQTTNWKDGRTYVNTAELDEDKNPTGEKKFILHEDGLQEVNNYMSHALGQCILKPANKEVEEKYFEENRKFNIFSMQPTTPEIEWKRDMTGGLMIGTSEVFNVCCSSTTRTKIMKATHKEMN